MDTKYSVQDNIGALNLVCQPAIKTSKYINFCFYRGKGIKLRTSRRDKNQRVNKGIKSISTKRELKNKNFIQKILICLIELAFYLF